METNTVRDKIIRISDIARRLFHEAEEIFREGRRRAREKNDKKKSVENAQKNFSIERTEDPSINDYH